MFWKAIINCLVIFLHWEVYVVGVMYLVISFTPVIAMYFTLDKTEELAERLGCLYMIIISIIRPFFHAFAIFVTVCTLLTILLGIGNDANWLLPWTLAQAAPIKTLVLLFIMIVMSIMAAFIPIIGRTDSITMLIMSGLVYFFVITSFHVAYPGFGLGNINFMPDLWTIIGFLIVSGITSWIGIIVISFVQVVIFKDDESFSVLMLPLASFFGLIPIFIYGAWLGLQIQMPR